ncbi:hypothetical protein ACFY40_16830 [Streptomyces sp. NPDC012950]|uniref:hypothetical protein n=1 Tax=Streptomyces sp. NPDC012950 TaxID=3364858 RepID=UPI0036C7A7B1
MAGLLGLLAADAETPRAARALLLVPPALGAGFSLPPLIAAMTGPFRRSGRGRRRDS